MFSKGLIVLGTICSLVGLSGDKSILLMHHHHKPNNNYNVVSVSDVKYETYDANGKKISSGSLKFTTKYLDTDDSIYS